ncbi:MAG: hypothetical protein MUO75_00010 [Actinobacteria bacterium]|nr:hypothetical protein [Actinomycetota bacterium]
MEEAKAVCGCGCEGEWPEPDPGRMKFLIGSGIASTAFGGYVVARRRPKWLPLWLTALVTWFTLCKYLICTRCERYGEACDFYYLGKWAARLFERQPDRTLDTAGILAEGGSVAVLQYMPMLAAIRKPRLLLSYLVLFALSQWSLLSICCRKCIAYSNDPWKAKTCPSYKQAQRLFGGART